MSDHQSRRDAAHRLVLDLLRQLNEVSVAETGHPFVLAAEFIMAGDDEPSPVFLGWSDIDAMASEAASPALPCPE